MDTPRSVVQYHVNEYGYIQVTLAAIMQKREITRNRLSKLTGSKYDVIDRYYKGIDITMADLDFLARVCYVLDCKIEDLLVYKPAEDGR
ncbi:MAG: helix-turn-helix transcriptional regulator [Ruminococcaceae bacterium]|nr:helix-turn-helix transcriptional regulator [Oscillospiraceae bacterium]